MEKYLLEVENDIEASILGLLNILPKEKIKFTKLEKSEVEKKTKYKRTSKKDPWEMLINANIDAPEDSSVEHDHYIHGTPKIYKNEK